MIKIEIFFGNISSRIETLFMKKKHALKKKEEIFYAWEIKAKNFLIKFKFSFQFKNLIEFINSPKNSIAIGNALYKLFKLINFRC
jgi:hypothetical protein